MTNSPDARARRRAVAERLTDLLVATNADEETVDGFGDHEWLLLVEVAHANDVNRYNRERAQADTEEDRRKVKKPWTPARDYIPSDRTKELIAVMLRYRLAANADTSDPFAGLPGVDD